MPTTLLLINWIWFVLIEYYDKFRSYKKKLYNEK